MNDKYFDCLLDIDQSQIDVDLIEQIEYFGNFDNTCCKGIKGSLRQHLHAWQSIGAYPTILHIIEHGYEIPFISHPPSMYSVNKSALINADFVNGSISDLLASGLIVKVPFKPYIVSPLSVAENRTKKRLILDLSRLNKFVQKEKIKFEDWKVALDFFDKDVFAVKFDLKSGYHHIDISTKCQSFLGFSWENCFYCYTVLPFGLSSAPFVFTKCLRPIVKHLRCNNIKIVLYLDDGLAFAQSYSACTDVSELIQDTLSRTGFVVNMEKSIFSPVKCIEWLGIIWDSESFSISIPARRIEDALASLQRVISRFPRVSARDIASTVGKVISMSPVMGNVCCIMTRYCSMEIVLRHSWDGILRFHFPDEVLRELHFWVQNIDKHNFKTVSNSVRKNVIIYSDASDVAAGAYTVEVNSKIFHLNWLDWEAKMSSTWREMKAIELALISFRKSLRNTSIIWHTDNQACAKIVKSGSMKPHLHALAFNIFSLCIHNGISIETQWVPRKDNQKADFLSKIIDHDDWGVSSEFFEFISSIYGPFTIDRFVNSNNAKTTRFNSKVWNPGSEAVDCFTENWHGHNNWLVPPIYLVIQTIKHLVQCKAKGVLIVPHWPSAAFWPVLFRDGLEYHVYVKDVIQFKDVTNIFIQGSNKKSLFGSIHFTSAVLAIQLDASIL